MFAKIRKTIKGMKTAGRQARIGRRNKDEEMYVQRKVCIMYEDKKSHMKGRKTMKVVMTAERQGRICRRPEDDKMYVQRKVCKRQEEKERLVECKKTCVDGRKT
jgi:hypothetical protein